MESIIATKRLDGGKLTAKTCPSSVEVALPTLTPEYATGVYCWLNRVNGKRYVGSSAQSILGRMRIHRQSLIKGNHNNRYLQRAWNKHGSKRFAFVILERCTSEDCIIREQYWIDKYRSAKRAFGYNICPTAGSVLGRQHRESTKKKIAANLMGHSGYTPNEEQRKLISSKLTGMKRSPETCAKIAAVQRRPEVRAKTLAAIHNPASHAKSGLSQRGKLVSLKTRAKISAAMKGKVKSTEHRAKLAAATRNMNDETRAKMSIAHLGKSRGPHSKETRAKIAAANLGRKYGPPSIETRKKIAAGIRLCYEKKRGIA